MRKYVMDRNLKLSQPIAFIVHVPNSLNAVDLQVAQEQVIRIEEAAIEVGHIPYVEIYSRVLLDAAYLPELEKKVRAENIAMLRGGVFNSIHISGSKTSAYVRDILYWVFRTRIDVYFVPAPGSILERYFRLLSK